MSTTLFKKVDYTLSKLIHDIDYGEIGLPDIQRPFVWKTAKVRDLFDSMYKGFPVGYLLFWASGAQNGTRQLGLEQKQKSPKLLIVDGQQRLTSLYAVLTGKPILNDNYQEKALHIAFRPRDARFEVATAATRKDPEFIADISQLWAGEVSRNRFVKGFIEQLRAAREVSDDEEDELTETIDRLYDIQNYPFTALELSHTVDEERVAEVFVRINSKGVELNQADFILTLMSVFWEEGRRDLERFCKRSRKPSTGEPSPYNRFTDPDPDRLLRVSVGLGFRRARLQYVYSILRGKDLETGQFSEERRAEQFEVLKDAQAYTLNLTHWHEFFKALVQGGFRSGTMVTSQNTLFYCYMMFLVGRRDFKVDHYQLRNLIAAWFFMAALTGRYTGSPESQMESDLARLRDLSHPDEFVALLKRTMRDELTDDFWAITLPNALDSSAAYSPSLFAYHAALSLLDARALFSKMKITDLLDPAVTGNKSDVERHHLFPKNHLKGLGVTDIYWTNQIANFAFVEWADNIQISDAAPDEYWPVYAARFSDEELQQMMHWHALPDGWETMPYEAFLEKRRNLIAQVTREGFERLIANLA